MKNFALSKIAPMLGKDGKGGIFSISVGLNARTKIFLILKNKFILTDSELGGPVFFHHSLVVFEI